MREAILNFLKLEPQNINSEILIALGSLYALPLLGFFFSIFSLSVGRLSKVLLLIFVTCVPLVGMYLYLLFCFLRADYAFLARFGLSGTRN
jgi:hypothetical protein